MSRWQAARASAGRLSWGVADQAVSSISNFAVGVVVARSLGAVEFGAFSIAWVTYSVVLNLSRGLGTDPLVVRHSGPPGPAWRGAVAHASGTALLVGLGGAAVGVLGGLAVGGPVGKAFVALGIVLPALLLQDSWRFAFFAAGQGRRALVNDLVWVAAMVPALFAVSSGGSVAGFVLAWGGSAAVAAVFGALQVGLLPRPAGAPGWVRRHRDLGLRYMVENVSISSAAQLRMFGLGAIAGLAAVGAVRGGQLLLGPFLALLMGVSLVSVPEAARVLARSPRMLMRFCALLGGGQAAAALLWGLALLVALPDAVGRFLLGDVWEPAAQLIVPTTLVVMAGSLTDGAVAGLRALGAARRSLRTQLMSAVAYVAGGLTGAVLDGARGSVWGVAAATLFGAAVAWWQLRAGSAEYRGALAAPTEPLPHVRAPRVSIGLPVYNGQDYLAQSLDALLAQSFTDFELIISDNASTDGTAEICRRYAAQDPRIRHLRQPHNIGAAPNHDAVLRAARGEYFKWAAHDDLYGPDLLRRCVEVLDSRPEVVLCHADMAYVDAGGSLLHRYTYLLATDSADPAVRLRSLLFTEGGDDEYGVVRMEVLRQVLPSASYHNPGRALVAEIAMHGSFHQVPELLYFRRDHPGRGDRRPTIRAVCANLDPRRARQSTVRLVVEYVLGYVRAVHRSPLTPRTRLACYRALSAWLVTRALGTPRARSVRGPAPDQADPMTVPVPRQEGSFRDREPSDVGPEAAQR